MAKDNKGFGAAAYIKGEQTQGTSEKSWGKGSGTNMQVTPGMDTVTINKKGFHQDDESTMRTARKYSAINQSANALLSGLLGREGKFVADNAGDLLAKRQAIVDKYNEQISTDAIAGYSTPTTLAWNKQEDERGAEGSSFGKLPDQAAIQEPYYAEGFSSGQDYEIFNKNIFRKLGVSDTDSFGFKQFGDTTLVNGYEDRELLNDEGKPFLDKEGNPIRKPTKTQKLVAPVEIVISDPNRANKALTQIQKFLSNPRTLQRLHPSEKQSLEETAKRLRLGLQPYKVY